MQKNAWAGLAPASLAVALGVRCPFRMKKVLRWIGIIIATPFVLFVGLYIFTLVVQLWPEPINSTFKAACGYDLPESYTISDRRHSYSNWMHGVWYTDHGKIHIDPSIAGSVLGALKNNDLYTSKGTSFEMFVVGKKLATCSVSIKSGVLEYGLVLW